MAIFPRGGGGALRTALSGVILFALSSFGSSAHALENGSNSADAPAALAAFVVNGQFEPGSFDWLRWSYSKDPLDQAKWMEVLKWAGTKAELRKKEVASALSGLGYDPARARGDCFDDEACGWVMVGGFLSGMPSWDHAKKAIDEARSSAEGYILAVAAMDRQARDDVDAGSVAQELVTRTRSEQTLRSAMSDAEAMPPQLSAEGKRAWRMFMWREIVRRDADNTRWLKEKVAQNGWPKRSVVGPNAAHAAWLLAQHADRDPIFQLQALRLMEPLLAKNEVTPKDYAFLYDRVYGELRGQQRYGTQMICTAGKFAPQPIEDSANLDKRRQAVGLTTIVVQLAKYTTRTC
jgi:hypothetical protein